MNYAVTSWLSEELQSFRQRARSPTTSSLILKSIRQSLKSVDGLAYKRTYKSRVINSASTNVITQWLFKLRKR